MSTLDSLFPQEESWSQGRPLSLVLPWPGRGTAQWPGCGTVKLVCSCSSYSSTVVCLVSVVQGASASPPHFRVLSVVSCSLLVSACFSCKGEQSWE